MFIAFNINHSSILPLLELNSLYCADVPLSNYSLTHWLLKTKTTNHNSYPQIVRQYELLSTSIWKMSKTAGDPNVHVSQFLASADVATGKMRV